MRKKEIKNSIVQLSIFDEVFIPSVDQINETKNATNSFLNHPSNVSNNLYNNERPERPGLSDEDGQTIRHESRFRILQSEDDLGGITRTTTGSFLPDDIGTNTGSFPQRNLHLVLPEYGGTPAAGVERDRGQRNRVAIPGGESRIINYHDREGPSYNFSGFNKRQQFRDNIAALNLIHQLETASRRATEAEQKILARYAGFGGLKEILLNPTNESEWSTQSDKDLRSFVRDVYNSFSQLDPDGSLGIAEAAKRSVINAHFTSYPIINAVYDAVDKAGLKGGKILEPAAGIGNFLAAMPLAMANNSDVTAIEMDIATGKILQKLFPTANTQVTGFEKIKLPENYFDLIISNVPFGDIPIYDSQLARHKNKEFQNAASNIHNYFFAKSVLLARPGGVIAFITSRYTLDSQQNDSIRNLINDTCQFLGAIRLPDNAFKVNAGTDVVADIIFLKKFSLGEDRTQQHDFLSVRSIPFVDDNNQSGILSYNEYFHNNPDHLLGTKEFGGLYRKDEFNLKGKENTDLFEAITNITNKIFSSPVLSIIPNHTDSKIIDSQNYIQLSDFDSIGNIVVLENGVTGIIAAESHINPQYDLLARSLGINPNKIREGNISWQDEQLLEKNGLTPGDFNCKILEPLRVNKADLPKLSYIENLRKLTKELIFKEVNNYNDFALDSVRKRLYYTYTSFTNKFGYLRDSKNKKLLLIDADCYVIQSLEKEDRFTQKIVPSDILFTRTINQSIEVNKTDNVQDAISLSLQRHGNLNMNYICELIDKSYSELMATQKNPDALIFIDETGNHLSRLDYLSGNVVEKLTRARQLAESDPSFQKNVSALENAQPPPIEAIDIFSPIHARWIPYEYVQDFVREKIKTNHFSLRYSKSADNYLAGMKEDTPQLQSYATSRKKGEWIFNHVLNGIEPIVTYTTKDENDNDITLLDAQDTHFAKEQYRKLRGEWDEWKLADINRREQLASIYNSNFNNIVLRSYDGSHLRFPGLMGFIPRQHQKDAIFRNVHQMGGINDHMVGAGKTLIQISTAMELRRLGFANKPLIIGLKSQIPQLYESFKKAYPLGRVLFPTEKDFIKENRQKLLNNIATNDWDCIIISHDQFNAIRQPVTIQEAIIAELTKEIKDEISYTADKIFKKQLESRLYKYEQKLSSLQDLKKDSKVLDFSQLGVDFLMVDESQEYKNLEFITTKRNVRGLGNARGSKKAFNLLIACRWLQQLHNGDKGILFSSGTPISNTMAELYLLFKYLRPSRMKQMGLTSFDRWAANFANDYSELEYYMGRFKEVHRFREFANLPELIKLYREIADTRNNSNLQLDKPLAVHNLVKIQPGETQLHHIEMLQQFIETKGIDYAETLGLTAGYDPKRNINPSFALLATNYAKKLSIDPRLINSNLEAGSKLQTAAENIYKYYLDAVSFKGTQLVFCDLGTPKSKNVVDNLYNLLENTDTSASDLKDIFGEKYFEDGKQPDIDILKVRIGQTLNLGENEVGRLLLEANTADHFNVYDELKRLLVSKGIPEKEIAFIHDYNTRKQKDALYTAMNEGSISITLGSTKKLGVGVNVQTLLIAMHHIDISWRPSDIEQRNGRGERQGNEAAKMYFDNKIPVFYYATERTLDASMYNTVSLKAKFIAQLKVTDNPEIRTIKDFEEDIDMGSMAAELSGDPVFKEKATLTKKINELSQLEKSFIQKRFSTENSLCNSEKLIAHYELKITDLNKALPFLDNIPRDEQRNPIFNGEVGGQCFSKIGEMATEIIKEAEHAKKYKPVGYSFEIGKVWEFKIIGIVKNDFFEKVVARQIVAPNGIKIGDEKAIPTGELAAALQIKNVILEIPDELKRMEKNIVTQKNNILEYAGQLKQSFSYAKELNEKKQRLIEVDKIILNKVKAESAGKNKSAEEETVKNGRKLKL